MRMSKKLPCYQIKVPKSKEWFKLIVAGDFHYGHKCCEDDSIRALVKWLAKKDPRTHRIIITGDLTENVIPGSLGSAFELVIPDPIDQEDGVVELLDPIKHLIVAMYDGNHAYRSRKASGHSPDEQIAWKLGIHGVYMGYSGYFRLVFPNLSYTIWGEHGRGGSRTVAGVINSLTTMGRAHPEADVYVQGHVHTKMAAAERVKGVEKGREIFRKRVYASNGSYLIEPEYAKRGGWPYGVPGAARIELNTQRKDAHCSV